MCAERRVERIQMAFNANSLSICLYSQYSLSHYRFYKDVIFESIQPIQAFIENTFFMNNKSCPLQLRNQITEWRTKSGYDVIHSISVLFAFVCFMNSFKNNVILLH